MAKQGHSGLTTAILATAQGMHRAGMMDDATHAKIMLRDVGGNAGVSAEPISAEEIRQIRERLR